MSDKTSLSDRMKKYERSWGQTLPPLMPVIIRIDGKAFHSFTKRLDKPFDDYLSLCMAKTTKTLCEEIQGCKFGYTQSDEISLLVVYYDNRDSQAWFGNETQKIVSLSAGIASAYFNEYWRAFGYADRPAVFDARAFVIPEYDVCNYFIWRQRDWQKNSIQMLARSKFSQKQLLNKNGAEMIAMLAEQGVDYTALRNKWRLGVGVEKGKIYDELPEFTKDRQFIEKYLKTFLNEGPEK